MAMKNVKKQITTKEYYRAKALGILGLLGSSIDPRERAESLTFVNNIDEALEDRLKEYEVWYAGDSDGLLNYYTRANAIDYNTDPLYNRNKKSYFWAVSSTEGDIKRSHSGQPRNVVDTLVNIIGVPAFKANADPVTERLYKIFDDNNFNRLLSQKQRPLTFVQGWGAYKINWDSNFRDTPIILYYRANAVDFVSRSNQLVAIIYKDYYQDENGKNYILYETRRLDKNPEDNKPCLIIEKELFEINGLSQILTPRKLSDLPQLKDVEPRIMVSNFNRFLGAPCIYFEDSTEELPGRSIFTGKLDLFDDLDQCHSQAANVVRRSTPTEVWDVNFLEKDSHTGMPLMPHSFDRKYVGFKGAMTGDGTAGSVPVSVTQPNIDFMQYSAEEQNILLHVIAGIMSPATLGIDVAKKDNAEAQREKEKVTIFTRNAVIDEEKKFLRTLANDALCADELMRTGKVTCRDYGITVKYDEFADSSWESKLETVMTAWQGGIMSDDMAIETLYKDTLTPAQKQAEKDFLKAQRDAENNSGMDMGDFGVLGADNPYNTVHKKPDIDALGLGDE